MRETRTPFQALKACEKKAGSMAALARDLGISQTAVWKWFQTSKRMPTNHVLLAEKLYGVSRHELDPHCYPRNYPAAPDARFRGVDQSESRFYA